MKTVVTNNQLAHLWVNESQNFARNSNNSCHFDGDLFFSYSTPVGKRLRSKSGESVYVYDSAHYSNTTSRHVEMIRRALSTWTANAISYTHKNFSVIIGGWGRGLRDMTPESLVQHYKDEARSCIKIGRSKNRPFRWAKFSAAVTYGNLAREAGRVFGIKIGRIPSVPKKELEQAKRDSDSYYEKLHANRVARQKLERERRVVAAVGNARNFILGLSDFDHFGWNDDLLSDHPELLAQVQARREIVQAEKIQQWLAGEQVSLNHSGFTYLRMKGDEVETSRGARFPVEEGKRAFEFAWKLHTHGRDWRRNGDQFQIGGYQLDSVSDKGIIAGCHHLHWKEIERFAKLVGWLE